MTERQNQGTTEIAGVPMTEQQHQDIEENAGPSISERHNEVTKESVGLAMMKPHENNSEENADVSKEKPLSKDAAQTPGLKTEKMMAGDIKEPAGEPQDNDAKQTAGSQTEEDDFVELENTPIVPRKEPRKKLRADKNANSARPRIFHTSFSRRRRYRYSVVSRRRRSLYTRRRRINTRPRIKPKVSNKPDETVRIKRFLRKFFCGVGTDIRKMHLFEGCMDKIQRQVRKYNRVAFSLIARYYHQRVMKALKAKLKKIRKKHRKKLRKKKPKDDANVKSEL